MWGYVGILMGVQDFILFMCQCHVVGHATQLVKIFAFSFPEKKKKQKQKQKQKKNK